MSNIKRYASLFCHNWSLILWFRKRKILMTIIVDSSERMPSFYTKTTEYSLTLVHRLKKQINIFFYRVETLLSTQFLDNWNPFSLNYSDSSSRTTHRCFANICIHNVRSCYTQFWIYGRSTTTPRNYYEYREANRSTTDPWNRWTICFLYTLTRERKGMSWIRLKIQWYLVPGGLAWPEVRPCNFVYRVSWHHRSTVLPVPRARASAWHYSLWPRFRPPEIASPLPLCSSSPASETIGTVPQPRRWHNGEKRFHRLLFGCL